MARPSSVSPTIFTPSSNVRIGAAPPLEQHTQPTHLLLEVLSSSCALGLVLLLPEIELCRLCRLVLPSRSKASDIKGSCALGVSCLCLPPQRLRSWRLSALFHHPPIPPRGEIYGKRANRLSGLCCGQVKPNQASGAKGERPFPKNRQSPGGRPAEGGIGLSAKRP